jgi:hypothetical protein
MAALWTATMCRAIRLSVNAEALEDWLVENAREASRIAALDEDVQVSAIERLSERLLAEAQQRAKGAIARDGGRSLGSQRLRQREAVGQQLWSSPGTAAYAREREKTLVRRGQEIFPMEEPDEDSEQ